MNSFRRRGRALPPRMGTPSGKPSPTSGNRKRQDAFHRRRFLHGGFPVAPAKRKGENDGRIHAHRELPHDRGGQTALGPKGGEAGARELRGHPRPPQAAHSRPRRSRRHRRGKPRRRHRCEDHGPHQPRAYPLGMPLQPGSQGPEHHRDVREEQGRLRPAGREGTANQGGKRAGARPGLRRGNQGHGSGGP